MKPSRRAAARHAVAPTPAPATAAAASGALAASGAPVWSLRHAWPYVLLLALAALLHLLWFGQPRVVVFDEVYFPKFGMAYLSGEYFFDLHPPLGKLIYALAGSLGDVPAGFSFATIDLAFPDARFLALRVPPALAGTLLPLLLAGVAREFGLSPLAAFTVGALAALDNGLLTISRYALIDPFLLLFGFGALYCHLRGRGRSWRWLLATGLLAGAAVSVKWTGFAFTGLIVLSEAVAGLRAPRARLPRELALAGARIASIGALVAAVYVGCFAAHIALLDRDGPDARWLSPGFQATLAGNVHAKDPALVRPGFPAKFVELHQKMWSGHLGSTTKHAYGSHWYDWPFMMRSVALWGETADTQRAGVYFLGNPAVWWTAGYCLLFLLVNYPPRAFNWLLRRAGPRPAALESALVLAYLANLLPFVLISRVMFAYHYLAALCVAIVGIGYLLDRCGPYRRALAALLLALAAAAFVYFAPLSYGLSLPTEQYDARFWVRGWR